MGRPGGPGRWCRARPSREACRFPATPTGPALAALLGDPQCRAFAETEGHPGRHPGLGQPGAAPPPLDMTQESGTPARLWEGSDGQDLMPGPGLLEPTCAHSLGCPQGRAALIGQAKHCTPSKHSNPQHGGLEGHGLFPGSAPEAQCPLGGSGQPGLGASPTPDPAPPGSSWLGPSADVLRDSSCRQ